MFRALLKSSYSLTDAVFPLNQKKQQKLFVQGYDLKVHNVIKYTRKHRVIVIISHASRFICVT